MVELRLLGSPELVAHDSDLAAPVLRRPKRLALLAYLAVESSGTFQRRDKLIGLFWHDVGIDSGFVMIRMADEPEPSEFILVQNFREELRR